MYGTAFCDEQEEALALEEVCVTWYLPKANIGVILNCPRLNVGSTP